MQAQSARQYDPELLNKLALSQLAAEELIKREIKCPVCGFYLMDVYGRDGAACNSRLCCSHYIRGVENK